MRDTKPLNSDDSAFEEELNEFLSDKYASLLAYAIRRSDEVTGRDLVQDALVRAWRFRYCFEIETNFAAWMFMILRNVCIDYARKQARIPTQTYALVEDWVPCDAASADPAQAEIEAPEEGDLGPWERWHLSDSTAHALDTLNPEFRSAVEMVVIRGMSHKEAADACGCPRATITSRLRRGCKILQRELCARA